MRPRRPAPSPGPDGASGGPAPALVERGRTSGMSEQDDATRAAPGRARPTLRAELKGLGLLYVVFVVFGLVLAGQCVDAKEPSSRPGAAETPSPVAPEGSGARR